MEMALSFIVGCIVGYVARLWWTDDKITLDK